MREQRLSTLSATVEDYEVMVKTKAADLAEIRSQLATSRAESLAMRKELDSKASAVEESDSRVAQANKEHERLKARLAQTEKELDSLRNLMAARRSEEAQRAEAESSREKELLALRDQLSRLSKQNASEVEAARKAMSELEVKYGVATTELQRSKVEKAKCEADLKSLALKLEGMQTVIKSGEAVKRGLDSDLAEVRQRLIQQQSALAEVTSSRDASSVFIIPPASTNQLIIGFGKAIANRRTQAGRSRGRASRHREAKGRLGTKARPCHSRSQD